jgi:hypothetical protein
MQVTGKRLQMITGILALGFGIYCLVLAMGMLVLNVPELDIYLLASTIIFAIIYITYGIFLLIRINKHMTSFIGLGLIITFWLPSDFQWYQWPLFIMPFLILILGLILLSWHSPGRAGLE